MFLLAKKLDADSLVAHFIITQNQRYPGAAAIRAPELALEASTTAVRLQAKSGQRIAQLLATGFGFVPMSSLTAGWILSGASSQWKNAKPGKVFETLLNGSYANPVMVVDEIDKAGGDSQHDPLGALYSLLEHDTATEFVDEFVEIPIDASSVVWIATANDERGIPEPILNRMNVFAIDPPSPEAARQIAANLYTSIRSEHGWGARFDPSAPREVLDALAELAPREMRRALMTAFGQLAMREFNPPPGTRNNGKPLPASS